MLISFLLPDNQFIAETPEAVTKKIRVYAALGLYQKGELSIGAASELANVDRYEFLELCKREGVMLHTQTPDELETEVKKLTGK
jgi:predicted HTH domain antitoxin